MSQHGLQARAAEIVPRFLRVQKQYLRVVSTTIGHISCGRISFSQIDLQTDLEIDSQIEFAFKVGCSIIRSVPHSASSSVVTHLHVAANSNGRVAVEATGAQAVLSEYAAHLQLL